MNLTKREHFAGLAMQGLQNVLLRKSNQERLAEAKRLTGILDGPPLIAFLACQQADALIAELAKCPHDFQEIAQTHGDGSKFRVTMCQRCGEEP